MLDSSIHVGIAEAPGVHAKSFDWPDELIVRI